MISSPDKLPGVRLVAWIVFDPFDGTIFKKSDSITTIALLASGQIDINFLAGTFSDTRYLFTYLAGAGTGLIYINTRTVLQARTMNIWNGSSIAYVAGNTIAIYFYA